MSRALSPVIEAYIDHSIGMYTSSIDPKALLVRAMKSCVGIQEEGGDNSGRLIEAIQSTIGVPQREAWCMALVQTCVAYVEKKLSLVCDLPASEHCLTVMMEARKNKKNVMDPCVGDLIIWRMGDTYYGHVGLIVVDGDESVVTIEGNTSPGSEVARNGDGVFEKVRSLFGTSRMKVQGFVRVSFYPATAN